MIIATDLDRTLLPNGNHSVNKGAMQLFKKKLTKNNIHLVYVTGRRISLVKQAMTLYKLPKCLYCISDVGTTIYKCEKGNWIKELKWENTISKDWRGKDRFYIRDLLSGIKELKEQPAYKLNKNKQSYYISTKYNYKKVLQKVNAALINKNLKYSLVYSIDLERDIAMVDILPACATKVGALKHVARELKVKLENVIYCGDSGNDILPIASRIKGILVKNASEQVRQRILDLVEKDKTLKRRVYFAKGGFNGLNGNYVSGIIEGAHYYNFFK